MKYCAVSRNQTRLLALLLVLVTGLATAAQSAGRWKQVHPHWHQAYVFSFRSPDLLSNEPDERWGAADRRLTSGGILTDFPAWLREHRPAVEAARRDGRPILLSLHVHSGYGVGLVTYELGLRRAQVANYPWLVRQLIDAGLDGPDVTVAVDTCNAQAVAAHQLRPDLAPRGIESWGPFARWRRSHPQRRTLSQPTAYYVFAQDAVAKELARGARSRNNVQSTHLEPLTAEERRRFRARMYGPKGVVLATPTLFNLLRLGPVPRNTMSADLLRDRLELRVVDGWLARNKREFNQFREYAFLEQAGSWSEKVK